MSCSIHFYHIVDASDLIDAARPVPLEVYGPTGIKAMTEHLLEAYRADFETRTRDRALLHLGASPKAHAANAHEIRPRVVYKDDKVTVTAFATKHAMESYGYRFDTPDRSIVITGDTNPTQATIDACRGCDVLIHEGQTQDMARPRPDVREIRRQIPHDDAAARRAGPGRSRAS